MELINWRKFIIKRKLFIDNLKKVMIFMNFMDLCKEYFESNLANILKIDLIFDNFSDHLFIKFHFGRFINFKNFD